VSKNGWLALGVALGAVLALAVVFALRGGNPVAVTPEPSAAGVSADGVPRPSSSEPGPAAMLPRQQSQAAPEEPGEPGAPMPQAPTGVVEPALSDEPPPPLADDPFAPENSREIDYAYQLVFGPDSSIESAKVAVDVFQRCLEASPSNRRCYDGLVAAQERQKPGWTPPPPVQPLAPHPAMRARQETPPIPGLPPPVEAMPPLKPVKARPKEFHAK
jgi:hypothetical protein